MLSLKKHFAKPEQCLFKIYQKLFTGTLKALEHLGTNTQCMDNVYSLTGITN